MESVARVMGLLFGFAGTHTCLKCGQVAFHLRQSFKFLRVSFGSGSGGGGGAGLGVFWYGCF